MDRSLEEIISERPEGSVCIAVNAPAYANAGIDEGRAQC